MVRKFVLVIVFVVLISFSSAEISLTVLNDNLNEGETFVGVIEADLIFALDKDDLKIIENRREIFFEKDVFQYNNLTFFYVVFSREGNFSIETPDLLYKENETLFSEKINLSLDVGKLQEEALSIKPGFLVGKNLSLNLVNVGNSSIDVKIQDGEINLITNSSEKVHIHPDSNFFYLDVNSYKNFKIPVVYFLDSEPILVENESEINQTINESESESISFDITPSFLEENLTTNKTFFFEILILNNLNESLNLSVDSSLSNLDFNKSVSLLPYENLIFSFEFYSEYEGSFSDKITFSSEDLESSTNLSFLVLSDEKEFDFFFEEELSDEICSDIGESCGANQNCVGGSLSFVGGSLCCVGGSCVSSSGESEAPKKNYFVGVISVLIAGLIAYFIYKKFKEVKPKSKI